LGISLLGMKKIIIILVLIALGILAYLGYRGMFTQKLGSETVTIGSEKDGQKIDISFSKPKKSPHYENNTPFHGEVLAGAPVNVSLDFNFDLARPSAISIKKDEKEYGLGETVIDNNKLAMRRAMDSSAPDGLYTVAYQACWPDGSCHDGNFQFVIDRSQKNKYTDMRGKKEVTIDIVDFAFADKNIWIDAFGDWARHSYRLFCSFQL